MLPLFLEYELFVFEKKQKRGDCAMQYKKFIRQPSIDMVAGIVVDKDTDLSYENEGVKQTIKDLVLRSEMTIKGESYESTYNTTIYLTEGDVLVFEEGGRGYIKPVERFVTVEEAIEELKCVHECTKG
jgi:hypothetical protein